MKRIVWSALALFLVSVYAATVKVRLTIPARKDRIEEQILAKVENIDTEPITICVETGQTSANKGEMEATPSPFWVEQNTGGRWGALLLGTDIGSFAKAEVVEAGKSMKFPFRLSDRGRMRLRLNYWPGSMPNLNCTSKPKDANQLAPSTFTLD
jgi:hypothetical protein